MRGPSMTETGEGSFCLASSASSTMNLLIPFINACAILCSTSCSRHFSSISEEVCIDDKKSAAFSTSISVASLFELSITSSTNFLRSGSISS